MQVPYLDCFIITTASDCLSIGTDGYGWDMCKHYCRMSPEGAQQFSRVQVPHLNRLIVLGTDQCLPIWAHGYTSHKVGAEPADFESAYQFKLIRLAYRYSAR